MTKATIYHNPQCSTSRAVLDLLRDGGHDVTVVEYLKTPLTAGEIGTLLDRMGVTARAILRRKAPPYDTLNLDDATWSNDDLIGFIAAHPILLERPIVVTAKGGVLCRPKAEAEAILASVL